MNKRNAILTIAICAATFAALGYLATLFGLNKYYYAYAHDFTPEGYAMVGAVVGSVFGLGVVALSSDR